MEKIFFEVAKILQDRCSTKDYNYLSRQDKLSIKNNYLSLLVIIAMGLNEYRKAEVKNIETLEIVGLKQKKMSL